LIPALVNWGGEEGKRGTLIKGGARKTEGRRAGKLLIGKALADGCRCTERKGTRNKNKRTKARRRAPSNRWDEKQKYLLWGEILSSGDGEKNKVEKLDVVAV